MASSRSKKKIKQTEMHLQNVMAIIGLRSREPICKYIQAKTCVRELFKFIAQFFFTPRPLSEDIKILAQICITGKKKCKNVIFNDIFIFIIISILLKI